MQFIPVVSIVGCAGMLALDAKTWVVNNFFTENVQRHENLSLKQSVASQTYDDPGSLGPASSPNDFSSFQVRLFSALNLLTGGCLGPIVAIVIIVAGCLGGLCC